MRPLHWQDTGTGAASTWTVSAPCFPPLIPRTNVATIGQYIFRLDYRFDRRLKVHEYIRILQHEGRGHAFYDAYMTQWLFGNGGSPSNALEAPAYLWEFWITALPDEKDPWDIWKRPAYPRGCPPCPNAAES